MTMQTEQFSVQNIKCSGCTSTIEQGLLELEGITSVSARIDGGLVSVTGERLDQVAIEARLAELGFPVTVS